MTLTSPPTQMRSQSRWNWEYTVQGVTPAVLASFTAVERMVSCTRLETSAPIATTSRHARHGLRAPCEGTRGAPIQGAVRPTVAAGSREPAPNEAGCGSSEPALSVEAGMTRLGCRGWSAYHGAFDVLIVWALDRFGRSMVGNLQAVLGSIAAGCRS